MDMTPALVEYIHAKTKQLEKLIPNTGHIYFECGKTTAHHKTGSQVYMAEMTLRIGGSKYYARVYGDDVYSNISAVTHDIVEQVKQKTDKKRSLWKRGAMRIKAMFKRG